MTQSKLRLYTFCNFYLNTISQGIQTAHVVGRMSKYYRSSDSEQSRVYWDWLEQGQDNETIVVLNGGMAADIEDAYRKFEPALNNANLPSGIFYEEPRALGSASSTGAPTCWGVVLSTELYDARVSLNDVYTYTDKGGSSKVMASLGWPFYEFLEYKNTCPLAR
jgi:hypothetical protein